MFDDSIRKMKDKSNQKYVYKQHTLTDTGLSFLVVWNQKHTITQNFVMHFDFPLLR